MPIGTAATRRGLLAAWMGVLARPALAAYPDRPIRLIIPFPPGGSLDFTARVVAQRTAEILGASVVVDSVPGAGGNVSAQRVARAAPDGYTLLWTAPNHTINPALMPNLGFDAERDFAPVSLVAQIPELLIAPVSAPFKTYPEMVAYARANPRVLTYSSAGVGSHPHVTMELLAHRLGIEILHVPYRGGAPALTDLVAGRVQLKLDTITTSAPHLAAGLIRALGIASKTRSPLAPDVPTIEEMGLPGFEGILWMGVLAPAGTPPDIVEALHAAFVGAVNTPAVAERLDSQAVERVGSSPAGFAAQIAREIVQWREVVRAADIRPE